MEIRINRENLLAGVQRVQGIVEVKGAMPILSYLLISTDKEGIYIQATDLEIGIKGYYTANVTAPGKVALNARKLHDIIRELPDHKEIHLVREENDWVTLKCEKSVFRLPGLPATDFPVLPDYSEESLMEFKGSFLKEMIRKSAFAVSPDETRKGISGLLLEMDNGHATMVGTDGHRLAFITRPLLKSNLTEKTPFILPKKTLAELVKLMDEDDATCSFSVKKNHFAFIQNRQVIVSRAIDGKFPNYQQVIPTDNNIQVVVNKDNLLHALRRVALLADEQSKMVRFEIKTGNLTLISDSTELGAANEEIAAEYEGEEICIGLNAKYVLEILGVIDEEEIVLHLKDKDHSCLIKVKQDQNFLSLVMPMRL